ncbi:hypothetical protein C5167_020621 [Papaver somniferum]|uniref:Uncharacterized protein n=1 Tax=Papaver somniferum TaxID=3469 RepID=A0A4Y7IVM3_PAPSO|nr:hypothetical protein C5167_020621 [Papaver somniferum]
MHVCALAKEIMDVSLGPHHADSIDLVKTFQKLMAPWGAYWYEVHTQNPPCLMVILNPQLNDLYLQYLSYTVALEVRQRVIDAWESRGPTAHDEMREARRLLEQLKEKAQGLSCSGEDEVFPRKALPLPLNSECAP